MAWRSHGYDQPSLVAALQKHGVIRSSRVADALRSIDRALFLAPGTDPSEAYRDNPVPIGCACVARVAARVSKGETTLTRRPPRRRPAQTGRR